MKITVYYNKNLKMSEGKLASQVGHVCKQLGRNEDSVAKEDVIVVLGLRQNKFTNKLNEVTGVLPNQHHVYWVQEDLGLTEVDKGTITCFGYIE